MPVEHLLAVGVAGQHVPLLEPRDPEQYVFDVPSFS
jgi:hypothetical protein